MRTWDGAPLFILPAFPGSLFALLALVMREPKRGGLDTGRS